MTDPKPDDGGPAYPCPNRMLLRADGQHVYPANYMVVDDGMSLRDWFAGQAMAMFGDLGRELWESKHFIEDPNGDWGQDDNGTFVQRITNIAGPRYRRLCTRDQTIAKASYDLADAMLKQRGAK